MIDQTMDINKQVLFRLSQLYPPPDFVKQAKAESVYGPDDGLQLQQYAYPQRRLFPCHSKAATWVSTAFFLDQKDSIPKKEANWIEERLQQFAEYYGISPDVSGLTEKRSASLADPFLGLTEDDYALVVDLPNTGKKNHYPMRNALEVKKAAEYLHKHRDSFRYQDRRQMAQKILKKVSAFGAGLGDELYDFLDKQAGDGVCSAEEASKLLWERVTLLNATGHKDKDLLVELTKTAKLILEKAAEMALPDNLSALAAFVDSLDSSLNLKKEYGTTLSRPEDVLFSFTKRAASRMEGAICQSPHTGSVFNRQDMEKLSLSDIRVVMGDDFANSITDDGVYIDTEKLAELLPTMPRPDAQLFERLCADNGIKPCLKKQAAEGFSPTAEEKQNWAKAYLERRKG